MEHKYVTIKNQLIEAIQNGTFKPGDKIYSEGELKKMYRVSSTTVVKALSDLVNEGYIIRRQGEGSFVRRDVKRKTVFYTEAFNPATERKSFMKVIEKTYTFIQEDYNNPTVAEYLCSNETTQSLTLITQVSTVNERTWKVQLRYVLSHRLSKEAKKRLLAGASLSNELNLPVNLITMAQETEITVAYLSEVPNTLQLLSEHRLAFPQSERAFLKICRISRLNDTEPIEYEISYIDPAYYTIRIEL